MTDCILALNGGSSSLKFAVYDGGGRLDLIVKGQISRLGSAPRLTVKKDGKTVANKPLGSEPMALETAAREIFAVLAEHDLLQRIDAVGHRIVHGGRIFTEPVVVDDAVLQQLRKFVPLAPLHQPYNLDIVAVAAEYLPQAVQVGCFDTAFHAKRPRLDLLYGLPHALTDDGIVAYGFHGLNYAHVASVLKARDGDRAGGRSIVAHLGSGASLCAMLSGRSMTTTMGFSALDGLVMSQRCGALDPGVILHLLTERNMSPEAISSLLYEQSGLLGVSGISGDMETLLSSADPRAAEAVDLFVYRIGRSIGSLAAAIGGLDTLVFTAGIGENAPALRARIGEAARWLGVGIDSARNENRQMCISPDGAAVDVLVIAADEERAVAEGTLACVGGFERSGKAG